MRKYTEQDFNSMVDFFDQMAQTSWFSRLHQEVADNVPNGVRNALDIGCGTGRLLLRLLMRVEQGVGVDVAPEMIKKAKEIAALHRVEDRLHFLVGDAYQLPFKNGQYDLVVSTCVLFLLPDPSKGMREAWRVLKKGGLLLTLNPSERMSPDTVERWIVRNGISEHEAMFVRKWADVSVRRNRLEGSDMIERLRRIGFDDVKVLKRMDGLAHITLATRKR